MVINDSLWLAAAVLGAFFLVTAFTVQRASKVAPKRMARVLLGLAAVIGATPALLFALAEFKS